MKALFGVVSLLVVLAIVGVLGSRQLKAMRTSTSAVTGVPADAASPATVRQQSKLMQDKVKDDITKALEQGAARNDQAEK